MNILIVDASTEGHHVFYNSVLLEELNKKCNVGILSTTNKYYYNYKNFVFPFFKINKIFRNFNYFFFVLYSFYLSRKLKLNILHFVSGDDFLYTLSIALFFFSKILGKTKVFITFHWYHESKKRKRFIYLLSQLKNTNFIFHSNYTKNKYLDAGMDEKKTHVINYPIKNVLLLNKFECRKKLGIESQEKVILIYGALRYDKGIDIAIKSLSKTATRPLLLIAGKEDYFTKEMINKISKENGIISKIRFDNGFILESLVPYYFGACDVVLIPYRKYFGGQSGVLYDAISYNRPVIAANLEQIKDEVKDFRLGLLFEPENINELAKNIDKLFDTDYNNFLNKKLREQFLEEHSESNFCSYHLSLYNC